MVNSSIYCYTNKINEKKYVGQTNNVKRRKKQHIQDSKHNHDDARYNQAIHCAIRKYGIDNFSFEILEELINVRQEVVNIRETYWIEEKKALAPNGYNLKAQGFANKGSNKTRLSVEELDDIRERLIKKLPINEIAELYNLSPSYISQINTGERLNSEEYNYPLQQNRTTKEKYQRIIDLLIISNKSMNWIAQDLGVSRDTVERINRGEQIVVKQMYDDFPIRKKTRGGYKIKL